MRKLLNMKLLFSVATVFMFLGFTVGSYGRAIVYVSSTQDEPVAVGEQMHLSIQIMEGSSVSGYELTVGFDPTALRYVEGENADYLPAGAFTIPPIVTENTVYMTATSGVKVALAREGTLATLTFEVIAAKGSTIELMNVILSDSDAMSLAVKSENGRIVTTQLPLAWDVNEDRKVNILDLTLVASNLNADVPANPRVDVNRDGNVNILDLVLVAQNLDAGGGKDNEPEVKVKLVVRPFATGEIVSDEEPPHVDADGFTLEVDGLVVYRQFLGAHNGGLTVGVGKAIEVHVKFLDHSGAVIHVGKTETFSLRLTDYDSAIIGIHLPEEGEEHAEEELEGEEGQWQFETVGLKAGTTEIRLQLLRGAYPDFTAVLRVPVTVQ